MILGIQRTDIQSKGISVRRFTTLTTIYAAVSIGTRIADMELVKHAAITVQHKSK